METTSNGQPSVTVVIDPAGICNGPALLTAKQVSARLGIGVRTLWRWVSSGEFPAADFRMGTKLVKWRCHVVVQWIEQVAERNAARANND